MIYLRQFEIKFANGFSQAYNLITCIPAMNSFMVFTRWSVCFATLLRNLEKTLPVHAAKEVIIQELPNNNYEEYLEVERAES